MISKRNIIVSLFLIFNPLTIHAEINSVSHGWGLFNRLSDSRITSLSFSTIAYPIESSAIALVNPALSSVYNEKIGLTHQSRIAGMVNSELVSFNKNISDSSWASIALLYEGVSGIPDTRNALLDWGNDGVFGTFDPGENNGILDEGERLDANKISYFSQNQIGLFGAMSKPYKGWELGIGMKLLFHSLDDNFALGTGMNFGAFRSFKNGTSIGIVLYDTPSSGVIWDNGDIELTPSFFSVGTHHLFFVEKYQIAINPVCRLDILRKERTIDSSLLLNTIPIEISGGIEAIYKRKIFARVGLYPSGAISTGLGILWENITIDYSYLIDNSISGIDKNHLITISLSSDWIKKKVLNKIK